MIQTKAILAERYKIHNPHNLVTATKSRIAVVYTPNDTSRAGWPAQWVVFSPYFVVDTHAHWHDHGAKTFGVYNRDMKEPKRLEALAWAGERYGITEWEKSPFGSYHPKGTIAKLVKGGTQ